jgi:hypothetical protein
MVESYYKGINGYITAPYEVPKTADLNGATYHQYMSPRRIAGLKNIDLEVQTEFIESSRQSKSRGGIIGIGATSIQPRTAWKRYKPFGTSWTINASAYWTPSIYTETMLMFMGMNPPTQYGVMRGKTSDGTKYVGPNNYPTMPYSADGTTISAWKTRPLPLYMCLIPEVESHEQSQFWVCGYAWPKTFRLVSTPGKFIEYDIMFQGTGVLYYGEVIPESYYQQEEPEYVE